MCGIKDLKEIFAENLINLRTRSKMTQLELGNAISYSDKAISKWERGESLPDIVTLKEIADLFSVSVDYLLRPDHPKETEVKQEYSRRQRRNHRLITAMSCVLVWLIATFVFVNIHLIPTHIPSQWLCFVYAMPVTAIVLLTLNSVWGNRHHNFLIISVLLWSVLGAVYLTFLEYNWWLIFVIGIPAQIIVGLWAGLRYK